MLCYLWRNARLAIHLVYHAPALTGHLDSLSIFGGMTSTFLYLHFSNLYFSSLWWTHTIFFAKLNKPPVSIKLEFLGLLQGGW